jgi:N-acetylneuraminate synthase
MRADAEIRIAGRAIGAAHPPFIIAELSGNHNGSIDRACELIDAAKSAGADAVKLQTYTADTITIDHDGPGFLIEDGLWAGRRLYDLYREAATPWEWHEALFDHARARGLIAFSTPFDFTAVDFLVSLEAPAYKIASFELTDLPLIGRAAATGKPLIISTGLGSLDEIGEAVVAARDAGCRDLILLHCTSAYPAPPEEARLRGVGELASRFGVLAGLSDHTPGTTVATAAVALGACVIEKHMTLRRADGGPDAAFSLEPAEFERLVADCRTAWAALGPETFTRATSETENAIFRRSLYVVRDVAAGEALTPENVRSIRPSFGMPPKHLPEVLGRRAARAIARGTPLSEDLLAKGERK